MAVGNLQSVCTFALIVINCLSQSILVECRFIRFNSSLWIASALTLTTPCITSTTGSLHKTCYACVYVVCLCVCVCVCVWGGVGAGGGGYLVWNGSLIELYKMCFFLGGTITYGKLPLKVLRVLACHGAPTGARNSSLGYPNMAEAALGKNFPKAIPSLLHVFNGWYLQGLDIWCVSLSRPQNFWGKQRHLARRGCDISSRDARI